MKKAYAAIIGFGKGGKTLAGALAAAGKSVILIEKSDKMYGGTCINVACIPTKSLVRSSELSAQQGGDFSVRSAKYSAAIDEKNRLTAMLRAKNFAKLDSSPNITVINGTAAFEDSHHLTVTGSGEAVSVEAEQIFINTGARPFVPPIPGLSDSSRAYLSETLLDLKELPRRLVIIGGGYIGLEFASIYANFGSEVTIIQDGAAFIPREDSDISAAVLDSLHQRGIKVIRSAKVVSVSDKSDCTQVAVETGGETAVLSADSILIATGRVPNTEGLNLSAAGVELTPRGAVKTDETLRTSAPNIYAMGDVVGGLQFTYISLDDFRIVKSALLGDGKRTTKNRGAVPYSVFIDPPFSRVGLTEKEAVEQGFDVKTLLLPAAAIPKAQVLGKTAGVLKAVIDEKSGVILGAHLFCAESHEMINTIKLAIDARIHYTVLRDAIYTHPTMSEAFNDLFAL